MAYTKADLARVERAIARGEKIVRYEDRTVEYRTVDELVQARNLIQSELVKVTGPRSRVTRLFHGGKGL
ncbi:phage head-tail joining protein [Pseudomonas putida]|uniref:Uncharacterized protein n=1 Tax=Pseudomonas putida TaxID=303 RepID=A0A177SRD4_PSEPU|nr:hypothetical protein [Pseudomonas putida]OAI93536.1 hypothetical protein AYO28_14185 [Pseudomonas putida]